MDNRSLRILLALAGLMCLLSQGLGASLPLKNKDSDKIVPIDELLLKAEIETNISDPFFFLEKTHLIRVEHDMVYSLEEWQEIHHSGNRKKRTAAIFPNHNEERWTNNKVNYELEERVFDNEDKLQIERAINELTHYTCLTFEQTNTAPNRIYIQEGFGGCYSRVGMVRGRQELGLSKGCRARHIIVHELCHAIGIHHEQTRPDRDNFVTIHKDKILDRMMHNFNKYTTDYINTYSLPYDYFSIMHYGPGAFAEVSGQVTIEAKDEKFQRHIGTNPGLSYLDIRTLNNMHSCVPDSCTLTDSDCGADGFVGKDCKCWCPGPTKNHPVEYCYDKDIAELGSLEWNFQCKNKLDQETCDYYESKGFCSVYFDFMLSNCEWSCNLC